MAIIGASAAAPAGDAAGAGAPGGERSAVFDQAATALNGRINWPVGNA